jgi:acyl carrier protein
MMQVTIEKQIRNFVVENFLFGESNNGLNDNDSLLETGIMDSTGVLELVAFVEENYRFKVKDEELVPENLDSIANISGFIRRKQDAVNL